MSRTPKDFALEYAAQGLVLIPLERFVSKPHRMLQNGWDYSWIGSSDEADIERWWSDRPWFRSWEGINRKNQGGETPIPPGLERGDPLAGIGLVCGSRSRILVIDVDRKPGRPDGRESLIAWQNEVGYSLAHCPMVSTPSGGAHLWLRLKEGQVVRRKTGWLPGVDACGDGGFVAIPPSAKDSVVTSPRPWEPPTSVRRSYEWVRGWVTDAPPAPDWLVEDVATRDPIASEAIKGTLSDSQFERMRERWGGELPSTEQLAKYGLGFLSGERNKDLYRLSFRLWSQVRGGKLSSAQVLDVVGDVYNATQDKSDFTWDEVLKTVYSARERHRRFSLTPAEVIEKWTGRKVEA